MKIFALLCGFCLMGLISAPISESSSTILRENDYAIFFAIDDYDDPSWNDLRNPVKDAEAIASELRTYFGFRTEIHRNPSRNEIRQVLAKWQEKSFTSDAQLLVFFSGHGTFSEFSKDGYFVPREGKVNDKFHDSHLPLGQIGNAVTQIPCNHILLAIDACYSGTIDKEIAFKGNRPKPGRRGETTQTERNRKISRQLIHKSRYMLTSGGKERTPDGKEHSPFTEGILSALRFTVSQGDGLLTWLELLGYMEEVIPVPHHGELEGHQEGGFVFAMEMDEPNIPDPKPTPSPQNTPPRKSVTTIQPIQPPSINPSPSKSPVKREEKSNQTNSERASSQDIPQVIDLASYGLPSYKLLLVEGGTFTMGKTGSKNASPPHSVRLDDFFIGETEVTTDLWIAIMGNGNEKKPQNPVSSFSVSRFSWADCEAFIKQLNAKTGLHFRFPTEAEWEFAAKGGNRSQGYTYAGSNNLTEVAWSKKGPNKVQDVRQKSPNELGLYDMSGNLFEWCTDWYSETYYQSCHNQGTVQNPTGPTSGKFKVARGGSFVQGDEWSEVTCRIKSNKNSMLGVTIRLSMTP